MKGVPSKIAGTTEEDAILDNALDETGFGKFHVMLILLVGVTYSGAAMEATVMSIILPAAKCDFNITSEDAGYLTSLPMLGMALGAFFWGAFADIFGRKSMLALSVTLSGISSLLSSISQHFMIFVVFRIINGFCVAGVLGLCFSYLGEFQPAKRREKILSLMELWWTAGIILIPCLAWLIIPIPMRYESKYFTFDSWNAYILVVATFVLVIGGILWTFPETPKFLCEQGNEEKALRVLRYIYHMNTGRDPSEYKVESILEKQITLINVVKNNIEDSKLSGADTLKNLLRQTILLFNAHHRGKTFLACFISFGTNATYHTLVVWLPELFTRFQYFEELHPRNETTVCQVSSIFEDQPFESHGLCESKLDEQVYMKTLILGLACIPTSIILPLVVNKLGFKFIIIFSELVGSAVCVGLLFVTSSMQNLILSCIFEAFVSMGIVAFFCSLVDLFPTNIRVIASGLAMMCGRFGALVGNLAFGFLIDHNCWLPITLFSVVLAVSAPATWLLPIKRVKKRTKTRRIHSMSVSERISSFSTLF